MCIVEAMRLGTDQSTNGVQIRQFLKGFEYNGAELSYHHCDQYK
jgi:hypothetical protein